MRVGIVGMPNAGKSSLFNALTRAGAEAANYPFTTIEPNVAVVPVVDERLDQVAQTIGASSVVYDTIDFHDIAGLVRGAHEGEGLGNQFLGNIRETDALVHDGHHRDVGLDRRERVVGRLGAGLRQRVEEARFARVGQADDADPHRATRVPSAAPATTSVV